MRENPENAATKGFPADITVGGTSIHKCTTCATTEIATSNRRNETSYEMKIHKSIRKAATAVLVGGLLVVAAPTFTAPANASAASQVPSTRASAKTTVKASATRVSGNRVRVVAKTTRAKKVAIKYRAGKAYTKTVRVRRGVARVVLPASTTRIQVRAAGSRWVRVGIPAAAKANPGKPSKDATNVGGSGGTKANAPTDPLLTTAAPLTQAEADDIRGRLEAVIAEFQTQARVCEANFWYPETQAFPARPAAPTTPQLNSKADAGIRRNGWMDWTTEGEFITASSWATMKTGDIAGYDVRTFGPVYSVADFREQLEDGMTCRNLMSVDLQSFTLGVMRTDQAAGNPWMSGVTPAFGVTLLRTWTVT